MPAADVSEQISLAGKEASGTGNMKLMMNGALTLGTLDGANVEIHDAVGDDNMFLFGMTAQEVVSLKNSGYNPQSFISNNAELRRVLDFISGGIGGKDFTTISGSIAHYDPFMVLADFADNADFALVAGVHSAQHIKHGSFARAAWPDNYHKLSLFNLKAHSVRRVYRNLAHMITLVNAV